MNGATPSGAGGGQRHLEIAAALQQIIIGAAGSAISSGAGSEETRAACEAYVDAVQRLLESNVAYVSEVWAYPQVTTTSPACLMFAVRVTQVVNLRHCCVVSAGLTPPAAML